MAEKFDLNKLISNNVNGDTKIRHMMPYFDKSPHKNKLEKVDTIVLHWTGGHTKQDAVDYLWSVGNSYHFIIDKDGMPNQCKPIEERANHAGESYGPNGDNVNYSSIGISFVTVGGFQKKNLITPEAITNAINLIGDIHAALKAEGHAGIRWVTTHYQISPGRKEDPYSLEPDMKSIMGRIRTATGSNRVIYWQAGMGPTWPKKLNDCECVEGGSTKVNGWDSNGEYKLIEWCKKSKGGCKRKKYTYTYERMSTYINPKLKDKVSNEAIDKGDTGPS